MEDYLCGSSRMGEGRKHHHPAHQCLLHTGNGGTGSEILQRGQKVLNQYYRGIEPISAICDKQTDKMQSCDFLGSAAMEHPCIISTKQKNLFVKVILLWRRYICLSYTKQPTEVIQGTKQLSSSPEKLKDTLGKIVSLLGPWWPIIWSSRSTTNKLQPLFTMHLQIFQ